MLAYFTSALTGSLLVYVPKLRFSSKYSERLRSPHKLKFAGSQLTYWLSQHVNYLAVALYQQHAVAEYLLSP